MNGPLTHEPLLGRYHIEQTIYRSTGSTVYKAFDDRMERTVVVKKIPASKKTKVRAVREARTVARLNHANIVTLYDFQETDEAYFLIMEHVNGLTLKDVLDKLGHFSVDAGLGVILQIAGALEFAHMNDVIHRDVKPENIMILPDGRVKVMDFGVAYLQNTDMTQKGSIVGTIAYMSPEQAKGEPVDERADVFSLAVVAYEILTGLNPFELETTGATLMKITQGDPERPSLYNREVSHSLDTYILKALSKEPDLRYDFMTDFRYKLERARTSRSPLEKLVKEAVRAIYKDAEEEQSNFLAARDEDELDEIVPEVTGGLEEAAEPMGPAAVWMLRLWPAAGVLGGIYALHQVLLGTFSPAAFIPLIAASLTVLISETLGYWAFGVVALAVLVKTSPLWAAAVAAILVGGHLMFRDRSRMGLFSALAGPLFAYPFSFLYPVLLAVLLGPAAAFVATLFGSLFMLLFALSVNVSIFGLAPAPGTESAGVLKELIGNKALLVVPLACAVSAAVLSVLLNGKRIAADLAFVFAFYLGMFFIIGSISGSLEISGKALAFSALVSGIVSVIFIREVAGAVLAMRRSDQKKEPIELSKEL